MTVAQIFTNLFGLLAGIGVFLLAIKLIGGHLEVVGGRRLKHLFNKTSKSNPLGVGIGVLSTAIVQSSGATSVMAIGFVSAGIMSVVQACSIVLGANIGTTITAQIAAIGFLGGAQTISASTILAIMVCIGAFMLFFAKKEQVKNIGGLLAGFGLLFVGLSLMSSSMEPFAKLESIQNFIASITFPGYTIVLLIIGVVLTALMQSSSVTSSIAITMYMSGLINLDQGIYLILGSNIGAVIVAILASLGTNYKAKQVAFFHLITNIVRVLIFWAIVEIVIAACGHRFTLGTLFEIIFPENVKALRLSMFHTFFNVFTVLIMMPLIPLFVKLSEKVIKEKASQEENVLHLYYLDQHLLKSPHIAIAQVKNEVMNMAQIAQHNFNLAVDIVCTLNFDEIDRFEANEKEINFLNKEIVKYSVELSKKELSSVDATFLSTVYHSVTDIERIGDYATNITEYAQKLQTMNESFSESAVEEIRQLQAKVGELYQKSMLAYSSKDMKIFEESHNIEQQIDDICDNMEENHIARLSDGSCKADVGAQFLSLTSDTERIADHWFNVSKAVKSYTRR
ncbi:MAG: Na/Pi cotransporter family protein [Clostridia bacterium]|nr:Na/Pi cotransporter family protein [Clostridia bacterium]